ncbi:MAG: DegV family protein [Lachnospiraceae bacterium]|nr:DegV family protein [Lachnospiraceae bacterium]
MVRIITDSASDFEPHEFEALNVGYASLYVYFGEEEYKENVTLTKNQFYEMLQEKKVSPRTSLPSLHDIECLMKDAMEAGDEMVIIPISSGLSGTCQSFVTVKEMLEYEDCYIVDSLTGTGGVRLLVEYAVKLRDQGKSAKEIAAAVEKIRSRVTLYTVMDTLEYLMRGGRISKSTYAIDTLINIKPIMHVTLDGKPEIPAKVRGMRKGIDYCCKMITEIPPDPEFPVTVMYTYNRTNGEKLAEALRAMGHVIPEDRIVPVGAVVGSHIGPDACAIVYIAKEN